MDHTPEPDQKLLAWLRKAAARPMSREEPKSSACLSFKLYSYIVLMLIPARALARQCLGVGFFCRTMRWNQRR